MGFFNILSVMLYDYREIITQYFNSIAHLEQNKRAKNLRFYFGVILIKNKETITIIISYQMAF